VEGKFSPEVWGDCVTRNVRDHAGPTDRRTSQHSVNVGWLCSLIAMERFSLCAFFENNMTDFIFECINSLDPFGTA